MPPEVKIAWERFVAGDNGSFSIVWGYFYPSLLAYCLGLLDDIYLAEDAVGDLVVKILKHPRADSIQCVGGYLFRAAQNHRNGHWSKTNRRKKLLEIHQAQSTSIQQEPDFEERVDEKTKDQLIRSILSAKDYNIWSLHMQGFNNNEIATQLRMTEKTVTNRKSGARKILRRYFRKKGGSDG